MKNNPKIKFFLRLIPIWILIGFLGVLVVLTSVKEDKIVQLKQPILKTVDAEKSTFIVFGDSGTGSSEQKQLAALMENYSPNVVIHTGDLAYPIGSFGSIQENVLEVYDKLFSKSSFYPSLGNHDYKTENGKPFVETFDLPGNERFYSFEIGKALFIALDSNKPLDENPSQMIPWLENLLSQTKIKIRIIYFHHPPYSSGPHGSEKRILDKLVPIFEKYKVDIVFSGHEHNYQRTCKILQGKCVENGTSYIVTGGGGAPLYKLGKELWFSKIQKSIHHFILGELGECQLNLKAIDINNNIFDKLIIDKC